MTRIGLSALVGAVMISWGSAQAQNANPYSGAAGFLYSQGRIAAPGQAAIPTHPAAPGREPVGPATERSSRSTASFSFHRSVETRSPPARLTREHHRHRARHGAGRGVPPRLP